MTSKPVTQQAAFELLVLLQTNKISALELANEATLANTGYAIGTDDGVWVNHGSGWVSLGLYVKQISAGAAVQAISMGMLP